MEFKVEKFFTQFPNLVVCFKKLEEKYPNTNPLTLIDLVKRKRNVVEMCGSKICCKCFEESDNPVLSLIKSLPATFCSIDCLKSSPNF